MVAADFGCALQRQTKHVLRLESLLEHQLAQGLHRRLSGHMTGVTLETNLERLPIPAQASGQQARIALARIDLQKTEASLQNGVGAMKAGLRQACRHDTGLTGPPHVQALDRPA